MGPLHQETQPGEERREHHGGGAQEAELSGEPASPGHGLGPGEAVRPGFDLSGDEGRTPEHADQSRQRQEEGNEEDDEKEE